MMIERQNVLSTIMLKYFKLCNANVRLRRAIQEICQARNLSGKARTCLYPTNCPKVQFFKSSLPHYIKYSPQLLIKVFLKKIANIFKTLLGSYWIQLSNLFVGVRISNGIYPHYIKYSTQLLIKVFPQKIANIFKTTRPTRQLLDPIVEFIRWCAYFESDISALYQIFNSTAN